MRKLINHEIVKANNEKIINTGLVFHGLLGSGKNLREISKMMVKENQGLQLILIDLRGHGDTSKTELKEPHNLDACGQDIVNLVKDLKINCKEYNIENEEVMVPKIIMAHSFGSKVALSYLKNCLENNTLNNGPRETIILDSILSSFVANNEAKDSVAHVIKTLDTIKIPIKSKKELIRTLVEDKQLSPMIGNWMSTNVRLIDPDNFKSGYRWAFDLPIIKQLFDNYQKSDFWNFVNNIDKKQNKHITVIRAGLNDAWTKEELEKFPKDKTIIEEILFPNTNHWFHATNPAGLKKIIKPIFKKALKN